MSLFPVSTPLAQLASVDRSIVTPSSGDSLVMADTSGPISGIWSTQVVNVPALSSSPSNVVKICLRVSIAPENSEPNSQFKNSNAGLSTVSTVEPNPVKPPTTPFHSQLRKSNRSCSSVDAVSPMPVAALENRSHTDLIRLKTGCRSASAMALPVVGGGAPVARPVKTQ